MHSPDRDGAGLRDHVEDQRAPCSVRRVQRRRRHLGQCVQQHRYVEYAGAGQVVVQVPRAAHKARVQVRFGHVGQWSKWWGIDNVFLGNRICTPQSGGLVVGHVTDSTNTRINGAAVAGGLSGDASPVATPTTRTPVTASIGCSHPQATSSSQPRCTATPTAPRL